MNFLKFGAVASAVGRGFFTADEFTYQPQTQQNLTLIFK